MTLPEHAAVMRCADTDRDLVAQVLAAAFAEGRLSREEHEQRLTAAWQARTFAELEQLTLDLAAPVPSTTPVAVTGGGTVARVDAIMGTRKREGVWTLPSLTTGTVLMGDVLLDLRQASFASLECVVDISVWLGDVKILLPAGVRVRDETTAILGDVKLRGLTEPQPGAPTLVLRSTVVMGDLKVHGPEHRTLARRLGMGR